MGLGLGVYMGVRCIPAESVVCKWQEYTSPRHDGVSKLWLVSSSRVEYGP